MGILKTTNLGMGDWIASRKVKFYNRTGATINYGEGAMVDILATQAESTSIVPGEEASVFSNVGPVTQAALEEANPIVVCAEPSGIADNAVGYFWLCGVIDVKVMQDDASTTDIDKGDGITILVSQAQAGGALTTGGAEFQAWVTGGTGTRRLGFALEDAAASGTGTADLKKVVFWGGIPGMGLTDT